MKQFLLFSLLFLLNLKVNSQDTLYFKNKEKVTILLLEVNPADIKYKRFDNQAGATYTVLKSEIEQIALSNGKKEFFKPAAEGNVVKTDTLAGTTPTVVAATTVPPSDSIVFRTGQRLSVKIYELSPLEVKYKQMSNLDGPVYTISKAKLSEIIFSTGLKQKLNAQPENPVYSSSQANSRFEMERRGTADAKINYRHTGGCMGTGVTALVFPPLGLIPAVICSSIPPKEYNLGYPDENLWNNTDYRVAYTKEAHRIKRKKVWVGFGIGTLTFLMLIILSGL